MPKKPIYRYKGRTKYNDGIILTTRKGEWPVKFDKDLGLRNLYFDGWVLGSKIKIKKK